METRVFRARNMKQALAKVREALGGDALILRQDVTEDGIEVSAAIDNEIDAVVDVALRRGLAGHVRERLVEAGFSKPVIDALPLDGDWDSAIRQLMDAVRHARLPAAPPNGAFRIVGPPGVGKTTLAIKLASHHVAAYGSDGVVLVTTDTWRLGGDEPLLLVGEMLDIPVIHARTAGEVRRQVDAHRGRLVVVDTPGTWDVDAHGAVFASVTGLTDVLVLPTTFAGDVIRTAITRFAAITPACIALSFVGASASIALVVNELLRKRVPLAWLTTTGNPTDGLFEPETDQLVRALDVSAATTVRAVA